MSILINPLFLLCLFILLRCADIAYNYATSKQVIRAIAYTVLAVLALLAAALMAIKG